MKEGNSRNASPRGSTLQSQVLQLQRKLNESKKLAIQARIQSRSLFHLRIGSRILCFAGAFQELQLLRSLREFWDAAVCLANFAFLWELLLVFHVVK